MAFKSPWHKPAGYPGPILIAKAESLSDELAALTAPIEAAAWELDEALSSLRKDAAGYRRANAANPDGGECYVPGELEQAVKRAERLLAVLSEVRDLRAEWDREDKLALN